MLIIIPKLYFLNLVQNNLYYYNKINKTINDDDKTSPEKKGQVQPTVFQFCPKCGQKNKDQFEKNMNFILLETL